MRRFAAPLLLSLFAGPLATLPWSGDDAITGLRNRLRHRGYAAQVTAGPMVALWSDEAPAHPLSGSLALPALARSPSGAYLVMTDAGDWWVWANGLDAGPLRERPTVVD